MADDSTQLKALDALEWEIQSMHGLVDETLWGQNILDRIMSMQALVAEVRDEIDGYEDLVLQQSNEIDELEKNQRTWY